MRYVVRSLVLVLVMALVGAGCASTATPVQSSGDAGHGEVDAALGVALSAAALATLAGLTAGSAEVCLGGAVASAGIGLAQQVYHGAAGSAGPVEMAVDARACAGLGLPAVGAVSAEGDARLHVVLQAASGGLSVATAAAAADPAAVAVLARVQAVLDLVAGAYTATVAALAAEAEAPDYQVVVTLAPDWAALGVVAEEVGSSSAATSAGGSSSAAVIGEEP